MPTLNAVRIKRTDGTWQDIAVQGAQGIQGPGGAQGPAGATGAPGATGSQGPKGDTGVTGTQGPQGVKGDTGAQGTQGPQGNTGSAGTPGEKWFTQAGAPTGATGIVGDWSLDSTSGDYYEKTGASAWTLRGNLKGPQGTTGGTGSQGPQGTTGATGSQGPQGTTGATGSQGPQGTTGATGAPGSVWRSGSGAPAGALGVVGDWYLNTANGDVYEKTGASAYTLRDNLTGPQGTQGPQGATGTTGATGSQGPQGATGTQGPAGPSGASTFIAGSGAPSAGTGVDGAIYLDVSNGRMYGPKAAGAWPASPIGILVRDATTYAQLSQGN